MNSSERRQIIEARIDRLDVSAKRLQWIEDFRGLIDDVRRLEEENANLRQLMRETLRERNGDELAEVAR